MKTKLYRLEEKLGLANAKKCTPIEVNAIEQVLNKNQKLPDGIYKSKSGKYYKYDTEGISDDDKQKYTNYGIFLGIKKLIVLMYILIIAVFIVGAIGLANLVI